MTPSKGLPWAGMVELRIPKLRKGCYFSDILKPRRTAETALTTAIQQVSVQGASARSADDLLRAVGMDDISKSQLSRLCGELDERAVAFLAGPVEGGWPASGWMRPAWKARRDDAPGRHIVWVVILSAWIGIIFAGADAPWATALWATAQRRQAADQFRPCVPRLACPALPPSWMTPKTTCSPSGAFPPRTKTHSNNPLDRLNGKIKHRTDVVGIVSNEAAVVSPPPWDSLTRGTAPPRKTTDSAPTPHPGTPSVLAPGQEHEALLAPGLLGKLAGSPLWVAADKGYALGFDARANVGHRRVACRASQAGRSCRALAGLGPQVKIP